MSLNLIDAALQLLDAGLSVVPAHLALKYPAIRQWKPYQEKLPTRAEVNAWFSNGQDALCIIAGAASGNLEMLDFDLAGEAFEKWKSLVENEAPSLLDRLVVETSPSGGFHVVYRSEIQICGSMKLAQRKEYVNGSEPVVIHGKKYVPRRDRDDRWFTILTLIETRGKGGLFLCAPSPGYSLIQKDFSALPVLVKDEREILLQAAWALNEHFPEPHEGQTGAAGAAGVSEASTGRPGDDFNACGDVGALVAKHGWTLAMSGENEYWRRPGKDKGWSATLKNRVFYVFSSSTPPFEPNRAYSPFSVYAMLEHDGDFQAAASQLRAEGYGEQMTDTDLSKFLPQGAQDAIQSPRSLKALISSYPALRRPVIHSLLREGETMNIIAPSKLGKSWLVIDLALAVATGRSWLGMETVQGDVLIIDNELHGETSANRIPKVAAARGIDVDEVADRVFVQNLRGQLQDLFALGSYFRQFEPGRFKIVILDAFYRFLPMRSDENDNGTMANLYNHLDRYADRLKCSFVLIHHTSKGNQSLKEITDVGAGAGAQSRATDTHLILRRHEEDDAVVLDAAVRSWPPLEARCIRWAFPVWKPADELDPTALRQEKRRRPKKKDEDAEPKEPQWTLEAFVEQFIATEPKFKDSVLAEANVHGLTDYKAAPFIRKAEACGLIHPWNMGRNKIGYATEPQPESERRAVNDKLSKRNLVEALVREMPGANSQEVAEQCGVSKRYVNRIRREIEGEN